MEWFDKNYPSGRVTIGPKFLDGLLEEDDYLWIDWLEIQFRIMLPSKDRDDIGRTWSRLSLDGCDWNIIDGITILLMADYFDEQEAPA